MHIKIHVDVYVNNIFNCMYYSEEANFHVFVFVVFVVYYMNLFCKFAMVLVQIRPYYQ